MKYPGYKYFYAVADLIILSVAFIVSEELYRFFYLSKPAALFEISTPESISLLSSGIMLILFFHYNHLYKLNVFLTRSAQLVLIIKSIVYGVFLIIIISFFLKVPVFSDSRLFITIYLAVSIMLVAFLRINVLRPLYKNILSKNLFRRRVVIVGTGNPALLFAEKLNFEDSIGVQLLGFIDDNIPVGTKVFRNLRVISNLGGLEKLKEKLNFSEIIISSDNVSHEKLLSIIDACKKLNVLVKVTSELFGIINRKIFSENYNDVPVIDISSKIHLGFYAGIKRVIDFIGALTGIVILSPLFIIISIVIKATSKGPVIFKQERIGRNGRRFNFYKFRSMKVIEGEDVERAEKMINFIKNGNGNGSDNGNGKIINESRITGIGKVLRKYSLDELPQLFNVLKGDMSLVGPRPCLPYEYANYDEWQKRRLSVLPGCTGLWQVTARSETNFNDSVVIDLYYINNITPFLDLQLIIKTIPVMLFARGGK